MPELAEASLAHVAARVLQILRLPNGTFAPKGEGRVLVADDRVAQGRLKGVVMTDGRHIRMSNGAHLTLAPPALQRVSHATAVRAMSDHAPLRPVAALKAHYATGAYGVAHEKQVAKAANQARESGSSVALGTPKGQVKLTHLGGGSFAAHLPDRSVAAGSRARVAKAVRDHLNGARPSTPTAPVITKRDRMAQRATGMAGPFGVGMASPPEDYLVPPPGRPMHLPPIRRVPGVNDFGMASPAEDPGLVAATAGESRTRVEASKVDGTTHHVAFVDGAPVGVYPTHKEAAQAADDTLLLSRIEKQRGMGSPAETTSIPPVGHRTLVDGQGGWITGTGPNNTLDVKLDDGTTREGLSLDQVYISPLTGSGSWARLGRVFGGGGAAAGSLIPPWPNADAPGQHSPGEPSIYEDLARVQWTGQARDGTQQALVDAGYISEDKLKPGRFSLTAKGTQEWQRLPREARVELGKKYKGMASPAEPPLSDEELYGQQFDDPEPNEPYGSTLAPLTGEDIAAVASKLNVGDETQLRGLTVGRDDTNSYYISQVSQTVSGPTDFTLATASSPDELGREHEIGMDQAASDAAAEQRAGLNGPFSPSELPTANDLSKIQIGIGKGIDLGNGMIVERQIVPVSGVVVHMLRRKSDRSLIANLTSNRDKAAQAIADIVAGRQPAAGIATFPEGHQAMTPDDAAKWNKAYGQASPAEALDAVNQHDTRLLAHAEPSDLALHDLGNTIKGQHPELEAKIAAVYKDRHDHMSGAPPRGQDVAAARNDIVRAMHAHGMASRTKQRRAAEHAAVVGQASPPEMTQELKKQVLEARNSKTRFPPDSKLKGMTDQQLAVWAIARNQSDSLGQFDYNDLKLRRAHLIARDRATAKTDGEAADAFRHLVLGMKPGEKASLPSGVTIRRYKDRGWGRPNYSITSPDGSKTSRTNKNIAIAKALQMGMATPGEKKRALTRLERSQLFPPAAHPKSPSNTDAKVKREHLAALSGHEVRLTYETGDRKSGKVEMRTHKYPPGIAAQLKPGEPAEMVQLYHAGSMEPDLSSVAKVEVKGANGRYAKVHDYGQTITEWRSANGIPLPSEVESGAKPMPRPADSFTQGVRAHRSVRRDALGGTTTTWKPDGMASPAERLPGLPGKIGDTREVNGLKVTRHPGGTFQLSYPDGSGKGSNNPDWVRAEMQRFKDGMASPSEDSGFAPDWEFMRQKMAEGGPKTLEDLAQGWGGGDPKVHQEMLDAIAAGRKARAMGSAAFKGQRSPAELPNTPDSSDAVQQPPGTPGSTIRELAQPSELPKGTLLYDSKMPYEKVAILGGPAPDDEYGIRFHITDTNGERIGSIPDNSYYRTANFTKEDWNALPKGANRDTYQGIVADPNASPGLRALAQESINRLKFIDYQAARRDDPLGGWGVDSATIRNQVEKRLADGVAGPEDSRQIDDLAGDMQDDLVRQEMRGDPYSAVGLRNELGQLEQLQSKVTGEDWTGRYTDDMHLAERKADLEQEGPDWGQLGQYSPSEPSNGKDGTANPMQAWLQTPNAYQVALLRSRGQLQRFGSVTLPAGGSIRRTPGGYEVNAGGATGLVAGDDAAAVNVADALERAPQPWLDELRAAWKRYSDGQGTKEDGQTITELAGGRPLYTVMASPAEKGALPTGFEPNSSAVQLDDMPDGQTFSTVDGFAYVKHKAVANGFVITKPYDAASGEILKADPHPKKSHGKSTRVLHGQMAPAGIGPVAKGYAESYDANPPPDPPAPEVTVSWQPGEPSPGRGKSGKLRNFKSMGDDKLAATANLLQGHGDTEAVDAVNAEMTKRGLTPHGSVAAAMPNNPSAGQEDAIFNALKASVAASSKNGGETPASVPKAAPAAPEGPEFTPSGPYEMYGDTGNTAVQLLVDKVADAPPDKQQAMLDAGLQTIAQNGHPEVHDTPTEEAIHAALENKGVPMTNERLVIAPDLSSEDAPVPEPSPAVAKVKDAVTNAVFPAPSAADLSVSPARSPKGNLRNFKSMSDAKLDNLAEDMQGVNDPEAMQKIIAELNARDLQHPSWWEPAAVTKAKAEGKLTPDGHAVTEPLVAGHSGPPTNFINDAAELIAQNIDEAAPGDTHELPHGTQVTKTASAYVVTPSAGGTPELYQDAGTAANAAVDMDAQSSSSLDAAATQLGAAWTAAAVQAALDSLEQQGVALDPSIETPETLVAVIKAAGIQPTGA